MAKTEDDETLLKDGEKVRVSLLFMDAKTVLDDGLTGGMHRPGYRYIATDSAAVSRIQEARDAYEKDLCSRWCSDAKENDPCTAPDGTPGKLQLVAGKLVCTPQSAAKTLDGWTDFAGVSDDADLRELAYALYDADVSSRWKGED